MFRLAHWTPRYAADRIRLLAFTLTHRGAPWLAPGAIRFLDNWLRPEHVGFEWGAGRSTLWFSHRVERLTSIEHNPEWYAKVQQMLLAQPRNNVDLRLVPLDPATTSNDHLTAAINPSHEPQPPHDSHGSHCYYNSHTSHDALFPSQPPYVAAMNSFPDSSLDFVLVDGVSSLRDQCALAAIPKIRGGGALIVDDIHRYMPSNSRAPLALAPSAEPATELWKDVRGQLASWKLHRKASGVTDTSIWINDLSGADDDK